MENRPTFAPYLVVSNAAAAIDFYKKHGFKTIRTLKNYYANGNDAYLMMKEL